MEHFYQTSPLKIGQLTAHYLLKCTTMMRIAHDVSQHKPPTMSPTHMNYNEDRCRQEAPPTPVQMQRPPATASRWHIYKINTSRVVTILSVRVDDSGPS